MRQAEPVIRLLFVAEKGTIASSCSAVILSIGARAGIAKRFETRISATFYDLPSEKCP